jgi:catechol 2,3-dioxygenase-like lactoylglutathione lyase family enzyme
MTDRAPFSTSTIHHIGLRVHDVKAAAYWLASMLGFRITQEFQIMGRDVVFMAADGAKAPVIMLIGGAVEVERRLPDDVMDSLNSPGLHHVSLQVTNLDDCLAELRSRDVKILVDATPGVPGSGVVKIAYIADPWSNMYELLQLAD